MIKNLLVMMVLGMGLFVGGCFTNDPIVGDERPPQMNNTPFTNFVPANTPK